MHILVIGGRELAMMGSSSPTDLTEHSYSPALQIKKLIDLVDAHKLTPPNFYSVTRPYNIDATGFHFTSVEDYITKSSAHFDCRGSFVEEYEIKFIDGNDQQLFRACSINQSNLNTWFENIECLADHKKS